MKTLLGLCVVSFACCTVLPAAQIGDTYDQIVAEKGPPAGKLQAGPTLVLRYPDQVIKIKDGRVFSLSAPPAETNVVRTPPPAPGAKPAVAAKPAPPRPDVISNGVKIPWLTDYNTALAQAKEQDRKVFMFFTGSDWCGWCHRLQREILTQPGFADYARDNLVLLEVDFPRNTPQSPALKAANANLAKRYQIDGFPTVIVLASDGRNIGTLGYQEGGPEPFVKALKRF